MKRNHYSNFREKVLFDKRAFTLVELLVVIAIIAVLFALIVPAAAKTREQAHAVQCMNNMRQLGMAALMYADDHNDDIPDVPDTSAYIDDEEVYVCPKDDRDDLGASSPSYSYFAATPDKLRPEDFPCAQSETILYVESELAGNDKSAINDKCVLLRHDQRTVIVFADGHTSCFTENQWLAFLAMLFNKGILITGGSVTVD